MIWDDRIFLLGLRPALDTISFCLSSTVIQKDFFLSFLDLFFFSNIFSTYLAKKLVENFQNKMFDPRPKGRGCMGCTHTHPGAKKVRLMGL